MCRSSSTSTTGWSRRPMIAPNSAISVSSAPNAADSSPIRGSEATDGLVRSAASSVSHRLATSSSLWSSVAHATRSLSPVVLRIQWVKASVLPAPGGASTMVTAARDPARSRDARVATRPATGTCGVDTLLPGMRRRRTTPWVGGRSFTPSPPHPSRSPQPVLDEPVDHTERFDTSSHRSEQAPRQPLQDCRLLVDTLLRQLHEPPGAGRG